MNLKINPSDEKRGGKGVYEMIAYVDLFRCVVMIPSIVCFPKLYLTTTSSLFARENTIYIYIVRRTAYVNFHLPVFLLGTNATSDSIYTVHSKWEEKRYVTFLLLSFYKKK